jgi:hypothetical protein
MYRVYELGTVVETQSTMDRCPWKATELIGARPVATPKLKGAGQGGRRGRGIHSRLHRRVSGGEAAGQQGSAVVVRALGGGVLWCGRRGEESR